jgi:type II secretory pathway component PulJ
MRNRQRGVSLLGLIVGIALLIVVLLLAMKTLPPWMDFFNAKKLITQIAQEQRGGSVADIRKAWQLKASIDNVDNVLSDKDLEITKEGGEVVISFAYRKEVPLFANVGVYMDFAATSKASDKAGN